MTGGNAQWEMWRGGTNGGKKGGGGSLPRGTVCLRHPWPDPLALMGMCTPAVYCVLLGKSVGSQ